MLSSLQENFSLWHLVRELGVTHSSCLKKKQFRNDTEESWQFFANRVIDAWNCLPDYVVSALSPLNKGNFPPCEYKSDED